MGNKCGRLRCNRMPRPQRTRSWSRAKQAKWTCQSSHFISSRSHDIASHSRSNDGIEMKKERKKETHLSLVTSTSSVTWLTCYLGSWFWLLHQIEEQEGGEKEAAKNHGNREPRAPSLEEASAAPSRSRSLATDQLVSPIESWPRFLPSIQFALRSLAGPALVRLPGTSIQFQPTKEEESSFFALFGPSLSVVGWLAQNGHAK